MLSGCRTFDPVGRRQVVAVADEAGIRSLDRLKAATAALGDPRITDPERAETIATRIEQGWWVEPKEEKEKPAAKPRAEKPAAEAKPAPEAPAESAPAAEPAAPEAQPSEEAPASEPPAPEDGGADSAEEKPEGA